MDICSIEESIKNFPLPLLDIKSNKVRRIIDNYLPYSIGIEIECNLQRNFKLQAFENIPNILNVNCDSEEQRYRIPNKLEGFICLYNICENLNLYSELNPGSGIHYHIDMTDWFDDLKENEKVIEKSKEWILLELDSWNYKGSYNNRDIYFSTNHNWVRFQNDFKTAEFRIGEMTFDYSIIVSRIIHCCKIIKKLKADLYQYKESKKIYILQRELEKLKETEKIKEDINQDEMKKVINNRIIKYGR